MPNKTIHWLHQHVEVPRLLVIAFWIISLFNFGAVLNHFVG